MTERKNNEQTAWEEFFQATTRTLYFGKMVRRYERRLDFVIFAVALAACSELVFMYFIIVNNVSSLLSNFSAHISADLYADHVHTIYGQHLDLLLE